MTILVKLKSNGAKETLEMYSDVKFTSFEKNFYMIVKRDKTKIYHKITDIINIKEIATDTEKK